MLAAQIYKTYAYELRHLFIKNKKYSNLLGGVNLFDVTLRDGLQSLSKEENEKYTLEQKMKLYDKIIFQHNPKNIEIGSIVSEKVLPIFKDTLNLFRNIKLNEMSIDELNYNRPNIFMLVPNSNQLKRVVNNTKINHFSFITSVSNEFQLKNTKQTLEESYNELYEMMYSFEENRYRVNPPYIKLYVSCINECPISGKIDNNFIVDKILNLNKTKVNNICLSDTCGTLDVSDFEYIVDRCIFLGLPRNKLSLHLHVKSGREDIVEQIIHKALDRRILNFDVSLLETGGCSITMNKNQIANNLSYELYYKSLASYIKKISY